MEKGMKEIHVIKRNGEQETLDLDKIHVMVEHACRGLAGVSESQVEMNANLQFFDGIETAAIQEILVRSANDLISLDAPNYQFVAARLLLFGLRKAVYNGHPDGHPPLYDHVQKCTELGLYDGTLVNAYSAEEWEKLNSFIDHDRDFLFTYAGIRQVVDKYLVQDRSSGKVYETPQFMYMMIAATLFQDDDKFYRLEYVKKYYDAISKHKINIPTPIMAGVRTPLRQFASCVLVDVDDTLDSIFSSDMAIGKYVAQRAGIGINAGRIRGINSKIRGGEVQHTGVVPFLKKFESTVRCCTQNGIRGGSATVHFPIWHQEIEDIIVLKNNKGTEDNRVRKLDYSIQFSKLFYERFISNGEISLFSPHNVPGLYDAFGTDGFDELYVRYERDESIPRKTIGAQELFLDLLKERAETGRLYIMNIDHCNTHSSFKDKVNMSNLCQEITLPTDPIQHIDGRGEIALCILSAINVGKLKSLDELDELCELAVRGLDALIDYQEYPVKAAEESTRNRRSLGIGYIGLAHYLAKHGAKYDTTKAHDLVHKLTERFQYALLNASMRMAMEKGPCGYFGKTKYADGILPIDTYKKEVDEIVPNELQCDWEFLRERILQYGLRHSTLSAQMPSESSSVVSNATNGIEPPRDFLSVKKSKKGPLKQIVPQYNTLKNNYTLLWDMPNNDGYIKVTAVIQKFFDQAISGNWSYNPEQYPDNEVPVSVMAKDLLTTYKYGWKTSYYQNTYDNKKDADVEENMQRASEIDNLIEQLLESEEEDCESCKI
ncbi:ribonucleotide reductase subunit A [Synechococcus phage S-RIM8 A.HR3]|uniref:Ribonucleoside-diphosphate reductase n=3 Tax=root TaxID=1 RepID=H6BIE3_9CAUD|nr:ribonucleotide reductase large subunit [Synechococcus phage S-RIM8 A.HR1]AFB15452.1 ribonucleotide reductase subunit A [Synechococcus phage S-RIM8 A.HR5]AFB17677.1 ribonucleotide reductase subunit A [Synechococcus phage S-RIM8 A.HR1]AFB17887.1 ribonucleotide reductase subunit A [Synechococcus phage S-RIM8 A.HR3]AGH57859.1 ribonucleotide reductase subunit A [Synechococcus phage KBS-M-1A]